MGRNQIVKDKTDLEKIEESISRANEDLFFAKKLVSDETSKLNIYKNQVENSILELKGIDAFIKEKEDKRSILIDNLSSIEKDISDSNIVLSEVRNEIIERNSSLDLIKEKEVVAKKEFDVLLEKNNKELSKLKVDILKLEQEKDSVKEENNILYKKLEKEINTEKDILGVLRKDNENLSNINKELIEKNKSLLLSVHNLDQDLENKTKNLKEVDTTIRDLSEKISLENSKHIAKEKEVSDINAEILKKKNELLLASEDAETRIQQNFFQMEREKYNDKREKYLEAKFSSIGEVYIPYKK